MLNKKALTFIIIAGTLAALTMAAVNTAAIGAKKEQRFHAEFLNLFDTVTEIVGYSKNKEEFTQIATDVHDELEIYHQLYDIYNDYDGIANIKTINDNAGKSPVKVDQKIIDMLKLAGVAYEKTDGKINVAMGSVLTIWHDYRTKGIENPETAEVPPMDKLKEAALHTDFSKVLIDEEASTVYLEDPDMRLDVGAIAKGYATEQVARSLEAKGIDHVLLSVGGNIRAIGIRADGKPWKLDIQNPDLDSEKKAIDTLNLDGFSLVSSGDYERYYIVDGVRYHHIIDPDTLMPAAYFRAVSIVCRDSGWADALSTAVFNLPYEKGLALVESMDDAEAMWVLPDSSIKTSSGYEAYRNLDR
ncbi:MAG TPA: FAD:protein FMN transferase [Lachnoclostridium sp.]|uniref:FAD:protein FMN transferase n=1 Tax=Lacrimispora sp. TaxID=2719234 RepID=UPI000EE130AF|nr:FAD:protein FMN transferase [Lacrimispora sp.]HCD46761.1 FAD:protein FMN transferase [Lachnoclostridium sp.]